MQENVTNTDKTSIVCRVKKVVFHNEQNGYSVLSVISDAEDAPFSICGILNGVSEGVVLHCQGEWKDHVMYGRQFIVDSWEEGKVDEVENLLCGQSRAKIRPVYRTWGEMLKHNPDVEANVKYVTEVFLTDVDKEYGEADCDSDYIEVPATAYVKAVYYAVYNGQKYCLLTCTFTTGDCFRIDVYDEDEYGFRGIHGEDIDDIIDRHVRYNPLFLGVEDFYGLSELDFYASGVPTCEDEMRERHYKKYQDDSDDDYLYIQDDYTVDNMKRELESAIQDALSEARIDYENCEYQCSKIFSRNKISGEIF